MVKNAHRPKIRAEIEREILFECGHRCAVCGTPLPLERAHIIPWRITKEHKLEDLICLCANCHQQSDQEKWGEKTLRKYKQNPWVLRQYRDANNILSPTSKVKLEIDIELSHFDENNQRWLQYAIAAFLNISPYAIQITSIEESHSIKVSIELPEENSWKLSIAYKQSDTDLTRHLAPLVLIQFRETTISFERLLELFESHGWKLQKIYEPYRVFVKQGELPCIIPVHNKKVDIEYVKKFKKFLKNEDQN